MLKNTDNAPQVGLIVPYSLFREKQYRDKISVSVKVSIKNIDLEKLLVNWFKQALLEFPNQ